MKLKSFNYRANIKRLAVVTVVAASFIVTQSFFVVTPHPIPVKIAANCDSIPHLNKLVIDFVESKINRKVGEGECWDLAAEALNSIGAKWDHEYKFGREVNIKKECIFAGDIMQFSNLKIDYKIKNTYYHEHLQQHTAIIYEVIEQDNFNIAEQNTSRLGQKVGITPLDLKNIKSGKFKVYRPIK